MSDRPIVNHQQEPPPSPPPPSRLGTKNRKPMKRYEYKLLAYLAQNAEMEFNRLGDEGWRYISREPSGRAVFEREKP